MKPNLPETDKQEATLQVQIPASTKRALHILAASSGETMRIHVLKALAAYGVDVPSDALVDRRRVR